MPSKRRTSKRPHQSSIDSYFEHIESALFTMYSPSLPASIQSSLLNVGMRVRKSVPEGYKIEPSFGSADSTTNLAKEPNLYVMAIVNWYPTVESSRSAFTKYNLC